MKQLKKRFFLFTTATLFCSIGYSQSNLPQIKGIIYGSDKEPSQFSTVVLMNNDSVFMKGTLSNSDGSFLLEKLTPGSYFIMVRNIEFNTHISEPIIIGENDTFVLDTVKLETKVTGLAEIVVRGEKSLLEVHPDKMVYNVAASINASGNNGLELLGKTPGVMVDMDKNIVLQGKSGVQIYINGRPSRLSGSDLTNMLESMQSDNIESIDIITNPSSKYEAEGSGGIIDIKLKRNSLSGFNGNIIGSYSKGDFASSSLGSTLNFNSEKLNIFTNISASEDNLQDDFVQITEREKFLLDMISKNVNIRKGLNLTGGLDYKINSESTIGLDAKALISYRTGKSESYTTILDIYSNVPAEILNSRVLDDQPSENYNMNFYYNYVPNGSSNFSADLSVGNYSTLKNTQQPNIYFEANGQDVIRSINSEYDAETDINLMSAKIDYEKRVNKLSFASGAKYSYVQTTNDLAYYNIIDNKPLPDANRSNYFSYLEKIAAAYFTFGARLTEKISLNSGLRVENTSSLGELESAIPSDDNVVARNYTSWFPNIGIAYDDQKNHALSFSTGRRITRPNYQDLNPFESKLSEISSFKGNPFLIPNYISNYQVTYSFKRKLVISNNYSITNNFFATIFEVVDDRSSVLIPRNMQEVIQNGLSVSYSLRPFEWWNFTSFFIYNYTKYDGDLNGTVIDIVANTYNFRLQNNIKLPQEVTMEVSLFASSPIIWRGSVYVEAFQNFSLGLKREFINNKLLVQITANDLLNTISDFSYNSDYGGIKTDGIRSVDNRRFGVSATYKFGNQKIKSTKRNKSAIDDELKRISE
jgi:iron complex outermembrane recepter protein